MAEYERNAEALAPLSPAGQVRRDEMLESLKRRVPRVAAARRRRRRALQAAAALALLAGGAWLITLGASSQRRAGPGLSPVAEGSGVMIEVVATRTDVQAVSISDDELLATLASIGRPTGLARIGDRVVLTEPVTDAERAQQPEPSAPPSGANASSGAAA